MSEVHPYFDSPEDQARMRVFATVLGSEHTALRNDYLIATRRVTPSSIQPTDAELHKICGPHNIEWRLGASVVTGYIGSAFEDLLAYFSDGSEFVHRATAKREFGNSLIGRARTRWQDAQQNMKVGGQSVRDTYLSLQARSTHGFIQCVTVEIPELPGPPKALHSATCDSIESQFMRSAFQGEPEALAEMHARLSKADPDVFHSFEAYDALRDLYLPPAVPHTLGADELFGKDR